MAIRCSKGTNTTSVSTTQTPTPTPPSNIPDSNCLLIGIRQVGANVEYNRLSFLLNANNKPQSMLFYDSVTNRLENKYNFKYIGDSVIINPTSWLLQDPITGYIIAYNTLDTITNILTENVLYQYQYDILGRLTQKRVYYNFSKIPDYISNYTYSGSNLINCNLYINNGKSLYLQSNIIYDTVLIKPWIYLYPDSFENNKILQGFSFGVHPTNTVLNIDTKIFNPNNGALVDEWITNFGSYFISPKKKVMQVTATGNLQQGLGIILGTMNFDYQCKAN